MNTKDHIKKYILIAFLIVLLLLGVYTAYITYKYDVMVRGLLGMIFIYLLFFYITHSGIDMSVDELLLASKKGKYFILGFIGPMIASWAIRQVMDMIWFFIEMFKGT